MCMWGHKKCQFENVAKAIRDMLTGTKGHPKTMVAFEGYDEYGKKKDIASIKKISEAITSVAPLVPSSDM